MNHVHLLTKIDLMYEVMGRCVNKVIVCNACFSWILKRARTAFVSKSISLQIWPAVYALNTYYKPSDFLMCAEEEYF